MVVVVVALLLMMSASWTPVHLWVMVSYKLVSIIDQDILQIIKHCLELEDRESYKYICDFERRSGIAGFKEIDGW